MGREFVDLFDEEVGDDVGDFELVDLRVVPGPLVCVALVGEELVVGEKSQERADKEGIPGSLLGDDVGEWVVVLDGLSHGIGEHVGDVGGGEWCECDVLDVVVLEFVEEAEESVVLFDFVVAVGGDDQEVSAFGIMQECAEEFE